ncbi:MAG TPA: patatin-like phospholipase family protein [Dehalococcoidia bacterium]|nr:patatin-like phospholipase family protein [Dehalococcoidia bacterium]
MVRILHRQAQGRRRPRVGVALGAGGSKGFAHVGVLRVLRDNGIPVDVVSGTSIGSIIAALYAAGFDLEHIQEGMRGADRHVRRWRISRAAVWSDRGLRELLEQAGAELRFEDLWLPFAAVATDLTKGACVTLTSGPLWLAVQASCAIPGVFPPVQIDGSYLMDGGISCPVPVDAARSLGADFVIAVDLSEAPAEDEPGPLPWPLRGGRPHVMSVLGRVREIQRWQLHRYSLRAANVVIRPGLGRWHWRDFSRHADSYAIAGEQAALKALPSILELLRSGIPLMAAGSRPALQPA